MEGLIAASPKSGYFVDYTITAPVLPVTSRPAQRPIGVSQWQDVLEVLLAQQDV